MKPIVDRSLSFVAALLLLLGLAGPARAGLVLTLTPGSNTDLSNVHVGDTLYFLTFGTSNADVDEYLLAFPEAHILGNGTGDLAFIGEIGYIGWNGLLDNTPRPLIRWELQATVAGTVDVFNGFPDCNGLPDDTSGCAVTNLGATRPDDSNRLSFTIYDVPEPSSIALAFMGLLALGYSRRHKGSEA